MSAAGASYTWPLSTLACPQVEQVIVEHIRVLPTSMLERVKMPDACLTHLLFPSISHSIFLLGRSSHLFSPTFPSRAQWARSAARCHARHVVDTMPVHPSFWSYQLTSSSTASENTYHPYRALALSLTCKSLLALAPYQRRLSTSDREAFLLLLEKDVGHNRYYCHTCSTLHHFSSSERYALASPTFKLGLDDCRRRALVYFTGSCITISYHHVRLAMNRHFLGPPNGIPLTKFQLEYPSRGPLYFRERWSAKIIQDELFLSATRTLYRNYMTDQELRHAIDKCYHAICIHVDVGKRAKHPIKALHLGSSESSMSYFTSCWEVVESCPQCHIDLDTTIEQRWIKAKNAKGKRAHWCIASTSYHRLGAGRSPSDAKWQAFAANGVCLRLIDVLHDEVVRPPRDTPYLALSYVWGGVKQQTAKLADFIASDSPGDHRYGTEYLPLERVSLPRTIQDAMELVEAIGERYLWVDVLCIMQDNEEELHQTLMDTYAKDIFIGPHNYCRSERKGRKPWAAWGPTKYSAGHFCGWRRWRRTSLSL